MKNINKITPVILYFIIMFTFIIYGYPYSNNKSRIWYAKDFGIYPNTGICYTDIVQELVDSSRNLKGDTYFILEEGEYNYTIRLKIDENRNKIWFFQGTKTKKEYLRLNKCNSINIFKREI